jgi:hypothetical protein
MPILMNLKVVGPDGACIVDAPMLSVTATTPLGSQQYVDSGFQCTITDKPLLDRSAIDQALDALDKLAGA